MLLSAVCFFALSAFPVDATECEVSCHASDNEAPVANADSFTLDQDTVLNIPAPGLLGNDTDGDCDVLTTAVVSDPANGTLNLNYDGSFSYEPIEGYSGSDSFSYIAQDGIEDSNTANVALTVLYVNQAPIPVHQNLYVLQDNPVGIGLTFTDADGPGPHTYSVIAGPTNGVLGSDDGDASYTYTPNPGFTGPDSFTFIVNDGINDSDATVVALGVVSEMPTPILQDNFDRPDNLIVGNGWTELEDPDTEIVIENNRLKFLLTDDATDRPMVTNTFARRAGGQLFWDFDFDWLRTRNEGTYRLFMQLGDSTLMNPDNWDAGVGINLIWTRLDEHEELGYRLGGTQTPLAEVIGPTSIRVAVDIDLGTYRVLANGVEIGSFIPMDEVLTLDTIRLFTDGLNDSNFDGRSFDAMEVSVIGDGEPYNRIPVADDLNLRLYENTTLGIELGVYDIDGPGPITYTVISGPANGLLGSDDGDATLTYTPNLGYMGPDSFTYRVSDGIDDSTEATVSLTVGGPTLRLRGYSEFTAGGETAESAVLPKPEDVTEGDLMIVVMTHGDKGVTVTPPSGWSLVRDDTVLDELVFPVFQKTAGPSEPDSYTFTIDKSRHPVAALLAFRGGAINAHDGVGSDPQSSIQIAPSVNAATNDILLYMAAVRADASFTPPSGMTEITDREETSRALTTAIELTSGSGPAGSRTGTSSASGEWAAALISITALTE